MKIIPVIAALLISGILSPVTTSAQSSDWMSLATGQTGLDSLRAFNMYVSDINNDGYPDILALKGDWGVGSENALRTYINMQRPESSNPKDRIFIDATSESGVNGMPDNNTVSRGTIVAAITDVNNDGHVDIVRGNYYHRLEQHTDHGDRCEVLLGDGTGKFQIVPGGMQGLELINVTGFSFLDYDKDGNIDLFIATWFKDYTKNVWDHGYLMKGNGDGTFTNVTTQSGITQTEPMYGCSVTDWNNDGWPDIATAPYCRTGGQLWKNNGNGTFTNVAAQTGYNTRYLPGDNGQAMCLWHPAPEDYDNDGDMDFFFALVHGGNDANEGRSAIFKNGGAPEGYRLTPDRNLTIKKSPYPSHNGDYDVSWLDIDNDGFADLAMAQGYYEAAAARIYLFRQQNDNTFADITADLGMIRTETRNLHAIEALDYDLDGDDDLLFCHDASPRALHLAENKIGQNNNWVGIQLYAPPGVNKSSIGARIYVWSGGMQRMREVYSGRGNNGGQQPFAMLFGLGSNTTIDSIKIVWPDAAGSETAIKNPPVNEYLGITKSGLSVRNTADEASNAATLKAYPNPARNFILLQLSDNEPIQKTELYDMTGRRIQQTTIPAPGNTVYYYDIAHLPSGSYWIRTISNSGKSITAVFVKQNQ